MSTQTFIGTLVVQECYKCHCVFGITQDHYDRAVTDGVEFFCPNGHGQVYTTTENDKLRKQLEDAQRTAIRERNWRRDAEALAEREQRSKAAVRGHLTRMRNKIANGVCPVSGCRRHFDNVQAHLAGQHADWLVEHDITLDTL